MATVEERPQTTADAGTIEVKNPATGETIAHVPAVSSEKLAEMVARARAAQPGWEALGFEGRGRILLRAQKWLIDNADRVIRTIVSETGKTYEDAQLAELSYGASSFGFWAKKAPEFLADEKVSTSNMFVKGSKLIVRYQPLGLIAVIGPWNYPLTNSFGDCIPALAAGNSVILKPASLTPLTSLLMAEMLDEVGCPKDVFQVAPMGGALAGELIDAADYVMFTGSTETGRKVMERAAQTITPVGLELGGKDPMIVLADANVDRAVNGAAYYGLQNTGQTCISVERIYVEEPIYDEFVAKLTDRVKSLRQGVPTGPAAVEVGAITSPDQLEIIDEHVKDAVAKGARVTTGGHKNVEGAKTYFEPTVIADADHTMEAMTEETFGPTLPVMKVRDAEEAIRLANDSPYGLAGSVWTKDLKRGEEVARRVQSGAVCVNDAMLNYAALELPMGGWKTSGLGSRHGANGIRKYCAQQSLLIKRVAPKRDLHMFPYKERTTALIGKAFRFLYGRGKRD